MSGRGRVNKVEGEIIRYGKALKSRVYTDMFPKAAVGGDLMILNRKLYRLNAWDGGKAYRRIPPPFTGMTAHYNSGQVLWYPPDHDINAESNINLIFKRIERLERQLAELKGETK